LPTPTRPITTIFSITDALLSSYLSKNIFRVSNVGLEAQKSGEFPMAARLLMARLLMYTSFFFLSIPFKGF